MAMLLMDSRSVPKYPAMVRFLLAMQFFFVRLAWATGRCALAGDEQGPEDVTFWRNGIALASSCLFSEVECGAILAVTLDTEDPQVSKVVLEGMLGEFGFRPHGIYLDNATQRLFVVSHSEVRQEESIVVFDIRAGKAGMPPSSLAFQFALVSTDLKWQGMADTWFINDVVSTRPNEVLTTQLGPTSSGQVPKYLWRCTWDVADRRADGRLPASCLHAYPKSSTGLNGITINAAKTRVWVNNQDDAEIWEFAYNSKDSSLSLLRSIKLPGLSDNFEYDVASNSITIGGFEPNGTYTAACSDASDTLDAPVIALDVSKFWLPDYQVSSAIVYGQWYVMGTPFQHGLLICCKNCPTTFGTASATSTKVANAGTKQALKLLRI